MSVIFLISWFSSVMVPWAGCFIFIPLFFLTLRPSLCPSLLYISPRPLGCQTGAPWCGGSLIRSDRHQIEHGLCQHSGETRPHFHVHISSASLFFLRVLPHLLPLIPACLWFESICSCFPFLCSWSERSHWFVLSLVPTSQSRLGSQSDAMAIQSIRNVRGNSFCVDCDAPSEYQFKTGFLGEKKYCLIKMFYKKCQAVWF